MPLQYEIPSYLQKIASAAKTNLRNKPECTENDFLAIFSSTRQEVRDDLQSAGIIDDPEGTNATEILRLQEKTLQKMYEMHRMASPQRTSGKKTVDRVVRSQTQGERKSPALSEGEIFTHIQDALVDALGVAPDEVTPHAALTIDLGAESIDFLDIVFRLEKGFEIKIPRGELFPENIITNAEFVEDGLVNAEGMNLLRERVPFYDLDAFEQDPKVKNFGDHLTVQSLMDYVKGKLATQESLQAEEQQR